MTTVEQRPCNHLSADGTGNPEEYRCSMCGTVYRYVEDPEGWVISYGADGQRRVLRMEYIEQEEDAGAEAGH
jgi:hypothetical protein